MTSPLQLFERQRSAFLRNPYPSAKERKAGLNRLILAVRAREMEISRAVDLDFEGRCHTEVLYSEIFVSLETLGHAKRNVDRWMEDRPVPVEWPLSLATAWVMPHPLGVVGIVAPWNYPLFLTLGPVAGAPVLAHDHFVL